MRRIGVPVVLAVLLAVTGTTGTSNGEESGPSEATTPGIVHGVYPGGRTGLEDDLTPADLHSYEQAAGKQAAWVYFSDNWLRDRRFPAPTSRWIRDEGAVPYIRLMMRSSAELDRPERRFTLQRIIDGDFDRALSRWCADAREFGSQLLVEYGVECNGRWFSWNGRWNGAGRTRGFGSPRQYDGAERFRAAYRHIVRLSRRAGADNITWAFHVNHESWPRARWNRMRLYDPGPRFSDIVSVSLYGVQAPMDDGNRVGFRRAMDRAYPRLVRMAGSSRAIHLAEFGAAQHPEVDQAAWARRALTHLAARRWPRISGISWWNEAWQNDDNPRHDSTLRLQDNPELAQVFRDIVGADPVFGDQMPPTRR